MRILRSALAGLLALSAVASASAQTFPTVPAHTVIGRIGIPGDTGPSQAIPFATLGTLLGSGGGTANNHAFAIGTGAPGFTSLLCGSAQLAVGQSAADPICQTITGDVTLSAGGATTLATVNANVGSFGSATQSASVTVDGKGRITGASQQTVTPAIGSVTGLGTGVTTALGNTLNAASGLVGFSGALGTPTSGTATNLTGTASGLTAGNVTTNANLTGAVTSSGNATSLGSFTSANLRTALTDEVGTGAAYFVGGALSTPASGTATNLTGLPLTTGVTGVLSLANGGTNNAITASSGGVAWSDATKLNVTAALGASQILLGGGAGAGPSASGCTIDTDNSPSCASGTSFRPAAFFTNSTADSGKASFAFLKSRVGGAVINGDNLGGLGFQAFANGGFQAASDIIASAVGAPVGSNVPSDIKFFTSNSAGHTNQIFRLDNNAHFGVSAQATAPTITAGCNGAGSSVGTNSFDNHGWITGQTSAATTCTITFGTGFGARPACVVSGEQSAILTMTPSASTLVVTFASTASYRFNWVCHGF